VLTGIFLLRNRLAGIENIIPKKEVINKTGKTHRVSTKKANMLSRLPILNTPDKEKIKNPLFPNCGIG
ncbi:MAG TPA: EamA/RhaT family transporter, partial [Nitrosarchaeum sp.]|nr:EamA/RhaT family transporter [Nitrosarchaeum sp.]